MDAAQAGALVLVTNGTYATGGRAVGTNLLASRVAVEKPLRLESVHGPSVTIIKGAKAHGGGNGEGAVRCAYLADGVTLSGFTLTGGATRGTEIPWFEGRDREVGGGGAWCSSTTAVLTNCVLTGNSAESSRGGAAGGT